MTSTLTQASLLSYPSQSKQNTCSLEGAHAVHENEVAPAASKASRSLPKSVEVQRALACDVLKQGFASAVRSKWNFLRGCYSAPSANLVDLESLFLLSLLCLACAHRRACSILSRL